MPKLPSRVMIFGCSGTGKSTLARAIKAQTTLPVIHLDKEYWQPGWVETEKSEWIQRVEKLVRAPSWVMDGGYASTFDLRIPRTEMIIWLDYPRWQALLGIFRRWWRYRGTVDRPDIGPGCPEKMDWEFFMFVWTYKTKQHADLEESLLKFGYEGELIKARSRRDLSRQLKPYGLKV
ncbi:MAG: adenylate kinase family enzyme [Parvibaculaceae bacterium]|jgi:adenylate kinase family enzyme|nr:hypothetical protein [Parvibaculaceae bacterium]|tara:strand:- start:480 stop:1010 length:531 start_codon:yes stop_codon:yes gene_type:complete